jgi:hypothetical protein
VVTLSAYFETSVTCLLTEERCGLGSVGVDVSIFFALRWFNRWAAAVENASSVTEHNRPGTCTQATLVCGLRSALLRRS